MNPQAIQVSDSRMTAARNSETSDVVQAHTAEVNKLAKLMAYSF